MHPPNIAVTVALAMAATVLPASTALGVPGLQTDVGRPAFPVSLSVSVDHAPVPAVAGAIPAPAAVESVARAGVRQAFELLPASDQVHLAQILKNLDQGLL